MGTIEGRSEERLLTLRVWLERTGEQQAEWRGRLQDINSGETRHFRDSPTLLRHLSTMLPDLFEGGRGQGTGAQDAS